MGLALKSSPNLRSGRESQIELHWRKILIALGLSNLCWLGGLWLAAESGRGIRYAWQPDIPVSDINNVRSVSLIRH